MAGITQTIPSFINGISEQPDHLKFQGQLRDIVNAIPDVTLGLYKRPGAKRIDTSLISEANGNFATRNVLLMFFVLIVLIMFAKKLHRLLKTEQLSKQSEIHPHSLTAVCWAPVQQKTKQLQHLPYYKSHQEYLEQKTKKTLILL